MESGVRGTPQIGAPPASARTAGVAATLLNTSASVPSARVRHWMEELLLGRSVAVGLDQVRPLSVETEDRILSA
ncbi:hypothetical protein D3C86_2154190 [compost metagenome]